MDQPLYDVFFKGELLDGFTLPQVRENLARLFKADAAKLDQLFSGRPCTIKKDVDKDTALKYQQAMKNAGARPLIVAAQGIHTPPAISPSATPSPPQPTTATASAEASPGTASGQWDLAPAGSELLKAAERPVITPVQVDISGIRLAPAFAPPVEQPPAPPPPDTSHISVAAPGEDLNPEGRLPQPERVVDVSALSVAEAGVILVEGKAPTPAPALDLSGLSLAEPGAPLTNPDRSTPPPAPDTSHLSVVIPA